MFFHAVYVAHVDHARFSMQRAVLPLLQALGIKRSGLLAGVVTIMPAAYAENAVLSKFFEQRAIFSWDNNDAVKFLLARPEGETVALICRAWP